MSDIGSLDPTLMERIPDLAYQYIIEYEGNPPSYIGVPRHVETTVGKWTKTNGPPVDMGQAVFAF